MASSERIALPAVIGVVRDKYLPAAKTLKDPAPAVTAADWTRAFHGEWDCDAHFVTYVPVGHGSDVWPRLSKQVLPRMHEVGADALATMIVLDFDNAPPAGQPDGHAPWTPESYAAFLNRLIDLDGGPFPMAGGTGQRFPLAMGWTFFYATKGGARFVYVLSQPVRVQDVEMLIRGVVQAWHAAGFGDVDKCKLAGHGPCAPCQQLRTTGKGWIDSGCCDWTRLFRLPKVMRDGVPTWEQPYFEVLSQDEARLDPGSIAPVESPWGSTLGYGDVAELTEPKPEPDVVNLLREMNPATGRMIQTTWLTEARRRLKGRKCYPCLFDHQPIAVAGSRDSTIQSFVGEAITLLFYLSGSSPELVYALFLDPILQLEPDHSTPDWTETLWTAVKKFWHRELAKAEFARVHNAAYNESIVSATALLLDAVRQWCSDPGIMATDSEAIDWLYRHLIVVSPSHLHVMRRDGYYDALPVTPQSLKVRIRELGMECFMPLTVTVPGKGNAPDVVRQVDAQSLINRYGTLVCGVDGVAGGPGTIIKNIGRDDAKLIVQLYRRKSERELEPCFNADVDEWLKRLAGKDYPKLCEWIGQALAFEDGPICALSIAAPPSVGKKMFVSGLAECINTECAADPKTFGEYQGMLKKSPFLVVNEGFNKKSAAGDIADIFRAYSSGDPILINEKFQELMLVRAPLRIILTANNSDVVSVLTGHRDLTPDDRDAIAMRIFHIDATKSTAKAWLRMKGGLKYTGRAGNRWVQGDSGSGSDFVVARHFMYLFWNRVEMRDGSRFLVEGSLDDDIMHQMQTRSGSAPLVIETLVRMIEAPSMATAGMAGSGLLIDDKTNRIFVTTSAVVNYFRDALSQVTGTKLTANQVGGVLKGFTVKGGSDRSYKRDKFGNLHWARWREIDPKLLLEEAMEHGYASTRLRKIVDQRHIEELEAGMGIRADATTGGL